MALIKLPIGGVIEILRSNQEGDFFNCVVITGWVRRGKSRLAYILAKGLYPKFTYEQNYVGNPKHGSAFKRMFDLPKKSVCWLDEGEKVLSAERRFDREQWWLQQLFNQFASHNKTIFICTPRFKRIDSRWREAHINIWIHVYKRGKGVLLLRRDIQSSLDSWGLTAVKDHELGLRSGSVPDEAILKIYDKNPCAQFFFDFPDWDTPEQKEEYETHKKSSQQDLREEFEKWDKLNEDVKDGGVVTKRAKRQKLAIGRFCAYLNWKYKISFKQLSILTGMSNRFINNMRDDIVRDIGNGTITEADLPPNYFPKEFFEYAREMSKLNDAI